MRTFLQNLCLVVISCLVALTGIEIGLRLFGDDVLAVSNQFVFYKFDPILGWANLPNTSGQFSRLEFRYRVETNSLAMRDREVGPRQPGEFRVAVIGDSFTWGVGAAYGERFTEVVEALEPEINVLNFGVSGYGPVQYLLELDQVLAQKPDFVVLAFCLSNDLSDNVSANGSGYAKPYARLSKDGSSLKIAGYPLIEAKGIGRDLLGEGSALRIVGLIRLVIAEQRLKRIKGGFELWSASPYGPDARRSAKDRQKLAIAYKVNELLLAKIRDQVTDAIGPNRLVVLLVPGKQDLGINIRPDADRGAVAAGVLTTLSRLSIPALDARDVIRPEDFWEQDRHWRPSGHRKVGEQLANYLARSRIAIGARMH